uniref:Large ribosomal subunit protein uL3 n=1 Tax=candidate division WOR-3 bacterium TaxID=2052148 RepID=A0A7V0Z4P4_UNCW3
MIGLIGKKIGMSQIFTENGKLIAVTKIEAGPCPVVQVKDEKKDGYKAIQIAFGIKKRVNKPLAGHLKKANLKSAKWLAEIKTNNIEKYKPGDVIDSKIFAVGDKIKVTGYTKGRGFSGGMKRWGWKGGPASHGSMSHRRIGSAGHGHSDPGRILKGKTMPGHYGNERVSLKNLKIVKIENNIIYLHGAVPGPNNGLILLTKEE